MDDINYDRLEYTQPARISGFASNLAIITWFKTHALAIDGWVKFTMVTKSDGELNALKAVVPAIGTLKRDLQSQMNVLFHVSEVKRFTAPQTLEINDLIADWSPQAVDILKNYWPGGEDLIPVDASHYDLLPS